MSTLHRIAGCDDDARRADVVFIHGLGGDAFGTWRHGDDETTSWPHWLGEAHPEVGVWSLGYAASPTRWARVTAWLTDGSRDAGHAMALPDRGLQVLDLMVQRGLGQRPILFVCHSLGGLVAKQVLRRSADADEDDADRRSVADATRAVLFLATPHAGAALATMLDAFRTVFGTTVSIEDLRAHDAHLRDLGDWYRGNAGRLGVETAAYFETRGVRGVTIVDPTSANPGVGAPAVGLDEDHLSIAKPRVRDAQVCGAASKLLRDHVLAPPRATAVPARPQPLMAMASAVPDPQPQRIPHELPPRAEHFFGRGQQMERLIERLRARKNTAVVGPAGMGKTALAAEAVLAVAGESPKDLAASPYPDGIVFLDLYVARGQAEPVWHALANKLAGPVFMERSPARDRAIEACRARRILVIVEGAEEADGSADRTTIEALFEVLSPENRWLLLTRNSAQASPAASITVNDALATTEAADLLDALSGQGHGAEVRDAVLALLEGHPLALTWAGNLIARGDESADRLVADWTAAPLPPLNDPTNAQHTLRWLFDRSVRGLDDTAKRVLLAAGLLARAPFPLAAMVAAEGSESEGDGGATRKALQSLVQRGILRLAGDGDGWEFTHVLGYQFARQESGSDPDVRVRLGRWLHGHVTRLVAPNAARALMLSPTGIATALEHVAALVRTDVDQCLWLPLVDGTLYDMRDRLTTLGQLGLARTALNAVEGWFSLIGETSRREPRWQRELSVLGNRQGDVLSAQGDLAGALQAYRESLAMSQRLAEADPSNPALQRDLSISQDRQGDVLRAQGDLAGALQAYRESLAVRQRLAEADPSNAAWQRDLSVSQERQGDVLSAQGDLAGALQAYRESLAVSQRLAEADPSNAARQRDLSVSVNKFGDVLRAQGDLAGALQAYRVSLAVRQRLAAADPSNAAWQRDLSVSVNKVGDVLSAQGDLAGALQAYRESLAVIQGLAAADPSNAEWQRDRGFGFARVAVALEGAGQSAEALQHARTAMEVASRLAALDPTNTIWSSDLQYYQSLVTRLNG